MTSSPEPPVDGRYVIRISGAETTTAEVVGGKGANLARLAAAGFDVPAAFALTTDAFARFLAHNRLEPTSAQSTVGGASIPEDVAEALAGAVARWLGPGPLAVRSSALGEDAEDASFAGQYDSVLGVEEPQAVADAVRRCWASAFSPRLIEYRRGRGLTAAPRMAVVVQRLLSPTAAGVAFTANPVTGDRTETLVSAVRGLGERLVSGEAAAEEWVVRGDRPDCTRSPEPVLDPTEAQAVAALARRVEALFGRPQDVEWAIADGAPWLLQARPITALPEAVEWSSPLPGGWMRNFRLGEWLPEPVTPLFESWLLRRLEEGFNAFFERQSGIPSVPPDHVVIHGWYFATLNFMPKSPLVLLWQMLTRFLPRLLRNGRRALAIVFPLHRFCVELFIGDWPKLLDRYRAEVREAAATVESTPASDLPRLIDRLATRAGEYYGLMTLSSGYAWKVEVPLATFYREHLEPRIGGTHQELLVGLFVPAQAAHDVQSLDWVRPTAGESGLAAPGGEGEPRRQRLEERRRAAEERARQALCSEPRLLRRFEKLMRTAQRFAPIRDEQISYLTLGWPVMRRAVLRLGESLVGRGRLARPDDVFFLSRAELAEPHGGEPLARERRAAWESQRKLTPPLLVGEMPAMVRSVFDKAEAPFRHGSPEGALVTGMPASPGRATGHVRVIRDVAEFERFQDGDVLVAPATMPAWTPLFARASAVVTDVGSVIAHAALVAREYGIPAIVGTGRATAILRDGERVTVDGSRGVVLAGEGRPT